MFVQSFFYDILIKLLCKFWVSIEQYLNIAKKNQSTNIQPQVTKFEIRSIHIDNNIILMPTSNNTIILGLLRYTLTRGTSIEFYREKNLIDNFGEI